MKQIKRKLINILNRELLIDPSYINDNTRLDTHLHLDHMQLNLLLYYFEKDLNISIPDGRVHLDQNMQELANSIYSIKRGSSLAA